MAEDIGDGLGGGGFEDCGLLEMAEQLRLVATERLILEAGAFNHVAYQDSQTLYQELKVAAEGNELAEATVSWGDGGTIVETYQVGPDASRSHVYYPSDCAAYKEVWDTTAWITEKYTYFDDLLRSKNLSGPLDQMANLRTMFNVEYAVDQMRLTVDGNLPEVSIAGVDDENDATLDWNSLTGGSDRLLAGWEGSGAEAFQINYASRFDTFLAGQAGLIAILYESLGIACSAYEAGYKDAVKVLDQAFIAFEGESDFDIDLGTVFTVFAAAATITAGILTAVPTGGASLGAMTAWMAGVSIAGGVASLGPTIVDAIEGSDSDKPLEISGATAVEVLNSLKKAADRVQNAVESVERETARWLGDFMSQLNETSGWTPHRRSAPASVRNAYFQPLRPALYDTAVDQVGKGDGGLTAAERTELLQAAFRDKALGTTTASSKNLIQGEEGDLRDLATYLSVTADHYGTLAGGLEAAEDVQSGFSSSALGDSSGQYAGLGASSSRLYPQWRDFHSMTLNIFTESADYLSVIATFIGLTADAMDQTDWDNMEKLWSAGND